MVSNLVAWLQEWHDWPGLPAVGKVTATRRQKGDVSEETCYCLLSQAFPPEQFNDIVRGHWGIENCLHWYWTQPATKTRYGTGKGMALNLARLEPSKGSMRDKLKRAGWDNGFLISILAQFAKIHMR